MSKIKRVRFAFKKNEKGKKADLLEGLLFQGFIELLGITDPIPAKEISYSFDKNDSKRPIFYEYVWSVGIEGDKPKWCDKLDKDDSIVIQLIFHEKNSRFSIREIAADLKQLPPFQKEKKIFNWLESLGPAVGIVGKGIEVVPGFAKFGEMVSKVSEMKLNTASTKEFPWWTKALCTDNEAGIEWHISKTYLKSVGGRFVGTLTVYFIDCTSSSNKEIEEDLSIEIRALLKSHSRELFISHLDEKNGLPNELYDGYTDTGTKLVIIPN